MRVDYSSIIAQRQLSTAAQCTGGSTRGQIRLVPMDVALIAGIVMLVLWAAGTFFLDAPGWINLLLSAGVFIIIWRIVVRGTATSTHKP